LSNFVDESHYLDYQEGKATMGWIAVLKAHVSRGGRDVTRTAREIHGANGILWET
jgi:alkylation response protein AidB-like acyl-CoA dehydrogenase